MNSKIYRQADSRWGSLPYPTKAYSFANNGCGCCSVTHCAIELNKYWNCTPADVRKYMVQFATKGHGTLWAGISKGLVYYGYTVHWRSADSMSDIFKVIEKSPIKRGVILFGSTKGPDKTVWTTGGHYIAFVDYKVENGKHYFYLKDSGGRHHDKWWCYEKSMRGDVRQVWICTGTKESQKPSGKYDGVIPDPTLKKGSEGTGVENWQKFLNWYGAFGLITDGKFGSLTKEATKAFQADHGLAQDGIAGPKTIEKAKVYKKTDPDPPTAPTTPTAPEKTTTDAPGSYTGALPTIRVKKNAAQVISDALAWGKWIAGDDSYHYGEYGNSAYVKEKSKYYEGGKYIKIHDVTHSCGCHFCGTNKARKVDKANKLGYVGEHWEKTYVCNTFVTAMYAHGGQDPTCLGKCRQSKAAGMDGNGRSPVLDASKNWTYKGKLAIKELKPGDVLVSKGHMQCVYAMVSDKKVKIIEATSYIGKYGSDAAKNSIRIKEKTPSYVSVYRFTGTVDEDIAIRYGEYSDRVGLLQEFLNWAGFSCGKADKKFGDKTLEALKAFQTKAGLTADGIAGKNTLNAMGKYKIETLPKKCIDVSYWQGAISPENWEKIRKTCGYAICRASYTSQKSFTLNKDSTFAGNFVNAKAAGLKVGAYHYSQAITAAEAKEEAEYLCRILKDYTPTFYVVCDFEFGGRLNNKVGAKASEIANAFCDVVKANGYEPCIYANTNTLNNYLKAPKYPVWVAQYNSECTYKGAKVMWQYTSDGSVDGVSGRVDLSHVY